MTGIWETADTITKARMNEKTIFQGTGSAISGLASTYSGMLAFCTSTSSGFTKDVLYQRDSANSTWSAVALDQKPYYTLSTTIGDYSQPYNTIASSETVNTADFIDDLNSSSGWTQTGSATTITGGEINCNGSSMGTDRVSKPLSFTLGSLAVFDFEFTQVSGDAGNNISIILSSSDTYANSNTGSKIYFALYNGYAYLSFRDGASSTNANDPSMTFTDGIKYYCRITRTASDAGNLKIYTNPARTIQYGTTLSITGFTLTAQPTLIVVGQSGDSGTSKALWDTLRVYNNVASVSMGATAAIDDSISTPWTSNSEANPYIYVDLQSTREIIGIALNINKTTTTVTSLKIRASTDTTFTDAENIIYVNISDFTDDTWRFLVNNFISDDRRYIQFYANETGVLSINEIKVRYGVSDTLKILNHKHNTRNVSEANPFLDSN